MIRRKIDRWMVCVVFTSVLICVYEPWECKGDVDLVLNDETENNTVCGSCISFTCVANVTNIITIYQNHVLCQSFERAGETVVPGDCPDLEFDVVSSKPDPTDPVLTIFVLEGRQCFFGGMNEIDIECSDVRDNSENLKLQVNSGSCVSNVSCHKTNCSLCVKEETSFEIEFSPECPGFEMLSSVQVDGEPANNMGSSEYCICVDQPQKITVIGTNPCSETTVISSTCEAVTITPEHDIATEGFVSNVLPVLGLLSVTTVLLC